MFRCSEKERGKVRVISSSQITLFFQLWTAHTPRLISSLGARHGFPFSLGRGSSSSPEKEKKTVRKRSLAGECLLGFRTSSAHRMEQSREMVTRAHFMLSHQTGRHSSMYLVNLHTDLTVRPPLWWEQKESHADEKVHSVTACYCCR